jgi:hypothetical protein
MNGTTHLHLWLQMLELNIHLHYPVGFQELVLIKQCGEFTLNVLFLVI